MERQAQDDFSAGSFRTGNPDLSLDFTCPLPHDRQALSDQAVIHIQIESLIVIADFYGQLGDPPRQMDLNVARPGMLLLFLLLTGAGVEQNLFLPALGL